MRFEWDPQKAETNLKQHRVSFAEAATVFDDPFFLVFPAPLHSQGEMRHLILGESEQGRLLMAVYVERGEEWFRVISAREATAKEVNRYEREKYQ
jgi:uncharacterized DUF497 family protein